MPKIKKIKGIHIYKGLCPDKINVQYSRDKNCPACNALDQVELFWELKRLADTLRNELNCFGGGGWVKVYDEFLEKHGL